jgi:hypothetical protein
LVKDIPMIIPLQFGFSQFITYECSLDGPLQTRFFGPIWNSKWLPGPIICSDWLKFQRSSSLKVMNWLNPNCKGMIIGMSFTKLLFFMPIGNPRWPRPA